MLSAFHFAHTKDLDLDTQNILHVLGISSATVQIPVVAVLPLEQHRCVCCILIAVITLGRVMCRLLGSAKAGCVSAYVGARCSFVQTCTCRGFEALVGYEQQHDWTHIRLLVMQAIDRRSQIVADCEGIVCLLSELLA